MMGCLASEMESAALFIVAGKLKCKSWLLLPGACKSGKREAGPG